ncbi:MAG: topoisomerase DNA-binding C4 zinc finger domain-containing protein [Chloroflexota bacterium]
MRKTNEIALHCTACGGQLIERENRQNGGRFLGCSNYPQCAHTAPIPAFVYQVRAALRRRRGWRTSMTLTVDPPTTSTPSIPRGIPSPTATGSSPCR